AHLIDRAIGEWQVEDVQLPHYEIVRELLVGIPQTNSLQGVHVDIDVATQGIPAAPQVEPHQTRFHRLPPRLPLLAIHTSVALDVSRLLLTSQRRASMRCARAADGCGEG